MVNSRHSRTHRLGLLAASITAAFGSAPCGAGPLPAGGKVVAGQATISQPAADTLRIQQGSANAAIDWRSFDIGRNASVVFQQPGAGSIVLNRVTGADPSQILGRLQANGQVFLVNPYGIVFGSGSQVDVAGLVASTANIRNDDLMAGRLRFTIPGRPGAQVVNEGQITVREGGLAALMAPGVANHGTISATLGTVALASGDAFTLDPYGDRLIQWVVPASQVAQVINSGTLSADGGSVQISARAAASVIDGSINLGGTVRARSVADHAGRIVLEGDAGTRVAISGTLDASGLAAGAHGGTVQATGGGVAVLDAASIDARGAAGGGQVLLGGGWEGAGGSGAVATTTVARGARIDVSAVGRGAGGTAVVWSDGSTAFDGAIAARGGAAGGAGGQVEVSGHRLAYDGSVDASAAQGAAGRLLLDPDSLLLQSRSAAAPAAGTTDVVTTESIASQLAAGTSVQLSAAQDITVASRIDARLVDSNGTHLERPGAGLTLNAGNNLALNADVILSGGAFSGIAGGRITQAATGATLATLGGDVQLQAGTGIALQSVQGARNLSLTTRQGSIELATPIGLAGSFNADVMQAAAGDRIHLNGLVANAGDPTLPAVAIGRASGDNGLATVQIDDHVIAAGNVAIRGAAVTLASGKAIDTRAASGGRAGSAVQVDAGSAGLALAGNVYTDGGAITLTSAGDLTQAAAAGIASGSGAVTLTAAGTATVTRVQTTGALTVNANRVAFDAGTTDTTVQAGTLQATATSTATGALAVRSSIQLGAGDSTLTSAADVAMQPGTTIQAGASGTLTINAARDVTIENLTSAGAGSLIQSAHGNVSFNQALGGGAAGATATLVTAGGDTVAVPTLYALDVRAPEGTIVTNGLLLYGLKGAPVTLDMPAAGPLAYGLNLAANEVDVRGLVFVVDGAVSIHGTTRLLLGNSVRSVGEGSTGGYPMSIGGGEIDVYRPTKADGSDYQNTDIIVAQYKDASGNSVVRIFQQVGGTWIQSTDFVAVVMPADLPLPGASTPLPSYWIDRTLAGTGVSQVAPADFNVAGATPVRLVSLRDTTQSGQNAYNADPASAFYTQGLASYDFSGKGRNPYVPLTYTVSVPGALPEQVLVIPSDAPGSPGLIDIPGTRFVPKVLVTNDPGPAFSPGLVDVSGVMVPKVGQLQVDGPVYETNAQGVRQVRDLNGALDASGDLRTVAFKVVAFDSRSIYQDSRTLQADAFTKCPGVSGHGCLDDPAFVAEPSGGTPGTVVDALGNAVPAVVSNETPRVVFPDSTGGSRCPDGCPQPASHQNPTSPGFQAAGYLSKACLATGTCDRPVTTDYVVGEQPKPGANPNAATSTLTWNGAQPGSNSIASYEYFLGFVNGGAKASGGPTLYASNSGVPVLGLGQPGSNGTQVKISSSLIQTPGLATFGAPSLTRVSLSLTYGVIDGQGITTSVDGTSAYKTTLPVASVGSADNRAAPTFSTILPTVLGVAGGAADLPVATSLPPAPVSVATQPPITAPVPGDTGTTTSASNSASNGAASNVLNALQSDLLANATTTEVPDAEVAPLLVLGGRGIAQSLDLGRSGGLGSTRAASTRVEYDVACTATPATRKPSGPNRGPRRDDPLPACR